MPEQISLPGMIRAVVNTHHATLTVTGYHEGLEADVMATGAESVEVIDLSLEEIFVETVKGGRAHA